MTKVKLPQLGENIESGEIVKVLAKEGDTISKDQIIIEIETDKAVTEVPSSQSGKVKKIHVKEGEQIKAGEVILELDGETSKEGREKEGDIAQKSTSNQENNQTDDQSKSEKYSKDQQKKKNATQSNKLDNDSNDKVKNEDYLKTSPSVRKLANELDVDLDEVKKSTRNGRITLEDIKNYASSHQSKTDQKEKMQSPDLDFDIKKLSNLRKKTAEVMSQAWQTTPMVTHFEEVIIDSLLAAKTHHTKNKKLTMSAIFLNALSITLMEFKKFNAVIDLANDEIKYYPKHNIGIAVDTDYGLVVPVLHDIYGKNIFEIDAELLSLSEKAKNRKLTKEDISGGTFTLTNLGSIGTSFFTPIIYPGQSAILGIGKHKEVLGFDDDKIINKKILPLSLTYDHRLIDGADTARFLNRLMELLLNPKKLNWNG